MLVGELSRQALARRLAHRGLRIRTGPVVTSIRSGLASVIDGVALHYSGHPIEPDDGFADFHVRIDPPIGARRFIRRQALFRFGGRSPFLPLPYGQAFPMLEWGLNWCISSHCHQFLVVHAAVLARDDLAVLLPAPSGSGKSTVCAALALRGWRLLSDELALIDPESGLVSPLARPISLKNASIDAIRSFCPEVTLGAPVTDTSKGTVVHMKPPAEAVMQAGRKAKPAWIVFPRYASGEQPGLAPVSRAQAFMRIVDNAFNYDMHGRRGFDAIAGVVGRSECLALSYARLQDVERAFDAIAERR